MNTMMLQPADAPGRAGSSAPPETAPSQPTESPPASAPPAGGGGGLSMGMMLLLPLVLFGIIILMNRGEKKRRAELETKLKKGDRVQTRSGLVGKLVEVGERTVRLEIAPGVNVTMVKTAIEGLDPGDTDKSKDSKDSKDVKELPKDTAKDKEDTKKKK
jgi:preprotein translocase subunit YajC